MIGDEDKVPDAFQKFNAGFERTILALTQKIMRGEESEFTVGQRELIAAFVSGTNACGIVREPMAPQRPNLALRKGYSRHYWKTSMRLTWMKS